MIFTPCTQYICLQKCCPYEQQFDLNLFKCVHKTQPKPLGINSANTQKDLDYFLFEKLDSCHFVKLLHPNLGVDRLYLTDRGGLVQRVDLVQGFTEIPPSRLYFSSFGHSVCDSFFFAGFALIILLKRGWGVLMGLCATRTSIVVYRILSICRKGIGKMTVTLLPLTLL